MSSRRATPRAIHLTTAAVVVALGACQPVAMSPPPTTAELSDSAWPTAVDTTHPDELFDAAHSVITRYLHTTDTITRDGGESPHRMAALTTAAWFPIEEAAFAHYRAEGLRTIGDTVFDSLVIQSIHESVSGDMHIDVIACVDATWVWLIPHDAADPPDGLMQWLRWGGEDDDISDDDREQWSDYLDTVSPQPGQREAIVFWLVGEPGSSLAIDGTINWEGAHTCHTTTID